MIDSVIKVIMDDMLLAAPMLMDCKQFLAYTYACRFL